MVTSWSLDDHKMIKRWLNIKIILRWSQERLWIHSRHCRKSMLVLWFNIIFSLSSFVFFFPSVFLSVLLLSLPTCPSFFPYNYQTINLSVCPSLYQFVSLSVFLFVHPPVLQPVCSFLHLSSEHQSICLSFCLFIRVFVSLVSGN